MGFSDIISNKIAESLSNCLRDNGEKNAQIQPPRHEKIIELINSGLKELSEHETIPTEQKPWEAREIAGNTKKNFFASIIQKTARNLEKPRQKLKDTNIQINNIASKISSNVEYCYELSKHILSLRDLRHQSLLGIDITPNCIYLCKIDGTNGKRVLKSLTSVCMEGKFMTEDIEENPEEYSKGLRSLIRDNNIKEKNVAISLPVSKSLVKTVTIPTMDDAEIKKALQFGSLWNNLMSSSQNPEDYSIFYQVIRRKKNEETMDVLFTATRLSDIQLYTDIVKKSGLNPVIVDLRCFAISHAFNQKINNTHKNEANVFLEFNFEESYAMITNGAEAHVFDIFITDTERAAIIDNYANEEVIDSFIKNYARKIKSTIDEYEDKHNTEIIKNIYVLSSLPLAGVIIEKLSKTLEYYTISHCNFFDCMQIDDDFTINSSSAINSLSSWSSAIGSALRHVDIFGKSEVALPYLANLLPTAGKYEKNKRAEYIANAAIMTASVAITWFVSSTQIALHYKNQELSSQLASLAGAESLYNKQASAESALSLAANNISEVDDLINEVSANQGKLLSIQKYLNVAIVDNVWLKEFNFAAPDQISITGGATEDSSILAFIDMLNKGQQFDKVALRGMQEIHELSFSYPEASTVKNFQIDGTISSAEMTTPPPSEVQPEDPAPVIIVDEKDKRVN